MGFWDKLKGLVPDINLLKIDNSTTINIQGNDEVHIGDKIIKSRDAVDGVLKCISDSKDDVTLPFQLIHEDLADDFIQYEEVIVVNHEQLETLSRLLPSEEVECVLMARRLALVYQKENLDAARDVEKQLEKNFPKQGKKVFNLMGGNYFDELIIPIARGIIETEKRPEEEFQKFYTEVLRFFPLAIFVGNSMEIGRLHDELNKRMMLKDIPFIRVHAAGVENIKKVEAELDKIPPGWTAQEKKTKSPSGIQILLVEFTKEK